MIVHNNPQPQGVHEVQITLTPNQAVTFQVTAHQQGYELTMTSGPLEIVRLRYLTAAQLHDLATEIADKVP